MLDPSVISSTSRRPTEITDWLMRHAPQRQPDRERGLWRFLTWPFFLAQVMMAGPFLGGGAQAALEEDEAGLKHTPHDSVTADELPGSGGRAVAGDDSETGADARAASYAALRLQHQQFDGYSVDGPSYRQSELKPAIGIVGGDGGGGVGDDASSDHETSTPLDPFANTSMAVPLPSTGPSAAVVDGHVDTEASSNGIDVNVGLQISTAEFAHLGLNATDLGQFVLQLHAAAEVQPAGLDAGFGIDVDVAHIGSNLAWLLGPEVGIELGHIIGSPVNLVTGLNLGSLPDDIGRLPLIGDAGATALQSARGVGAEAGTLVGSAGALAGEMLAGASSSAANVVSELGDFALLQNKGDISSGDRLIFPELPAIKAAQVDQLFVAGQYTDYHLALQSAIKSTVTKGIDLPHNETLDHLAGVPATAESSTDKHDAGNSAAQPEQHAIALPPAHLAMDAEDLGLRSPLV
jgi:hypothetical protein